MLKHVFYLLLIVLSSKLAYSNQPTIYLTFDDGPLGGTENILDVIEQEEVNVTFFMVGMHLERFEHNKQILNRIHDSIYVSVGNHSYSHAYGRYRDFYRDIQGVKKDMEHNNHILELHGNICARLPGRDVFRLPNIYRNDRFISKAESKKEEAVSDLLAQNNFYLYGWDHEWESHASGKSIQSVEKLIQEIDNHFLENKTLISNKLILLMHDQMFKDEHHGKEKLYALIQQLRKKNYRIANLREYAL